MYKLEFGEELFFVVGFFCVFFFLFLFTKKVIQRPGSNLYKRVCDPAMILEKRNKIRGAPPTLPPT